MNRRLPNNNLFPLPSLLMRQQCSLLLQLLILFAINTNLKHVVQSTSVICSLCNSTTTNNHDNVSSLALLSDDSIIPKQYRNRMLHSPDSNRDVTCEEIVDDILQSQRRLSSKFCTFLHVSRFYEICGGCIVSENQRILLNTVTSTSTLDGLFTPTSISITRPTTSNDTITIAPTPTPKSKASVSSNTTKTNSSSIFNSPDDDLVVILPSDTDSGMTSNTTIIPTTTNAGKGNGTTCYVCGGDENDTISNGQNLQSLPKGNLQLPCAQIFSDGQAGSIPSNDCCYFQTNADFRTNCGCISSVAPPIDNTTKTCNSTTTGGGGHSDGDKSGEGSSRGGNSGDGNVGGNSTVGGRQSTTNVCYVCRNDSLATMLNPNVTYPLPQANKTRSCGSILQDGLSQLIPNEDCTNYFIPSNDFYSKCGCHSGSATERIRNASSYADQSSATTISVAYYFIRYNGLFIIVSISMIILI